MDGCGGLQSNATCYPISPNDIYNNVRSERTLCTLLVFVRRAMRRPKCFSCSLAITDVDHPCTLMQQDSDREHVERQTLNSLDLIDMLRKVTALPDISSVEHV